MIIIEDLPFLPSDLLIKKALMNHLQYSIWRQQKVYKSSLQFMEVYSSFYFLWLLETWPVRERETTDWEEECRQWDPATGPLCSIITAPRIINTPGLDQFCQTGLNLLGETRSEKNRVPVPHLWVFQLKLVIFRAEPSIDASKPVQTSKFQKFKMGMLILVRPV